MQGFPEESFTGRPVIGILNSWSEVAGCNAHLRDLAEHVKRGVLRAGGFPVEIPVISLGEPIIKPTAMLYRNLMAMAVEELIRGNPVDGVVLLASCDKTIPASLMGAASVDVPAMMVTGGPMLSGRFRNENVGACTDCWRLHDELRAGRFTQADWDEFEAGMCRSDGHCSPMGTASTMACLTEALGMAPAGSAAIPAVDSRRRHVAERAGAQIMDLVAAGTRPSDIMTRHAFENAIRTLHAIGGSTNAVIHLLAIAGRQGVDLPLDLFDELAGSTPLLANVKPSGAYLMEDFFYAGGLPAVHAQIADLLHLDALTVTGRTVGESILGARIVNDDVIRPRDRALLEGGSLAILRGSLCPDGAVLKVSAASPQLLQHEGRAVVFGERRRAPRDDRRSRPRHPAGRRPRPPEHRAGRRARHARDRAPADALVPPAPGRHRHGPDQRRPDERHRVRDGRPPRRPGVGGRWAARPRPDGRPHPARHRRPPARPARRGRGARGDDGRPGCRVRRATSAAIEGCTSGR